MSLPGLLLLAALAAAGAAQRQEPAATEPPPRPRDVTAQTRADAAALAALQTPGEILFRDGFEDEESWTNYFEVRGRKQGRVRLVDDPELAHSGRGALRLDAPENDGQESGAGVSAWLGDRGHERIHFRRYLRFAADYDQGNLHHTGGGLAGVAGTGKWDGMGKAGVKPTGADRFSCGMEPWRGYGRWELPGAWALYTYWMDMERDRDGNHWGNLLMPAPEEHRVSARGEWVCIEQMIQVNTPCEFDGELAAWVDGELYLHLQGIRWRSDPRVTVKRMNLGIYVHRARADNTVWYDDVVLSTGYIGPIPPPELLQEAIPADEEEAAPEAEHDGTGHS